MSKRKELEEADENSLKAVEDSIKSIKAQSDFVPFLYERKIELEAYRLLINSADDEAHTRCHPYLILFTRTYMDDPSFDGLMSILCSPVRSNRVISWAPKVSLMHLWYLRIFQN